MFAGLLLVDTNRVFAVFGSVLLPTELVRMYLVLLLRSVKLPSLVSNLLFRTLFLLSSVKTLDWVRVVVSIFCNLVSSAVINVFRVALRLLLSTTQGWLSALVSKYNRIVLRSSISCCSKTSSLIRLATTSRNLIPFINSRST